MSRYWLLFAMLPAMTAMADNPVPVGEFSTGKLDGWTEKSFAGHTDYQLVALDGQTVLQARSKAAASGLVRKIKIDLGKTPYLNWRWKIDATLGHPDERSKQGDDYPARVYVVFSGGAFFWRTRALTYVWSSSQPKGAQWANAYTGNVRMIAVRSGQALKGQWVTERRNIRADFKLLFGTDIRYLDAVAVMSDTDNTGGEALAWYGDIYFSAQ